MGLDLLVLGFAAMNRLPREGVPQDKGDPFLRTEVRQPLPGEHTFAPDDEGFARGRDNPQERCGGGGQILVHQLRAVLNVEQVSTVYGAVVGFPKKPRPLGKPADRLTWGRG
ncbi:MAG TPA: hypothetical protein VGX03_36375 [Candidatus Binatia bacterium]|nr:hypothetical protein [Candidatus Binatia bacterium]